MIFCLSRPRRTTRRIRGRAVKALRSGRSQLCWRGFESHRMQHLFCFFVDPRLLSIELAVEAWWLACTNVSARGGGRRRTRIYTGHPTSRCRPMPAEGTQKALLAEPPTQADKKGYGGTGIRARVKRITTAYANHYTIPPRLRHKR
jgi:hypothetical protein